MANFQLAIYLNRLLINIEWT